MPLFPRYDTIGPSLYPHDVRALLEARAARATFSSISTSSMPMQVEPSPYHMIQSLHDRTYQDATWRLPDDFKWTKTRGQMQNFYLKPSEECPAERSPRDARCILGWGAQGAVYRVACNNRVLALKTFNIAKKDPTKFLAALKALKRLNHIHIVQLIGSCWNRTVLHIILNPVADCSLSHFMERIQGVRVMLYDELQSLLRWMGCLCTALAFIHSKEVKHRDIKPGNILIIRDTVLLADWDLTRDFHGKGAATSSSDPLTGTSLYAAPEVLDPNGKAHSAGDVFSLGLVLGEMLDIVDDPTALTAVQNRRVRAIKGELKNPAYHPGPVQPIERAFKNAMPHNSHRPDRSTTASSSVLYHDGRGRPLPPSCK